MTTRVQVQVPRDAGYSVLMISQSKMPDGQWLESSVLDVRAGETGEVYIHSTLRVLVEEVIADV